MGATPEHVPFEFLRASESGAQDEPRLGYAQVMFVPSTTLDDTAKVATLHRFLEATYEGWQHAIRDPRAVASEVIRQQPQGIDHWVDSLDFAEACVRRCRDYVKASRVGSKLGGSIPSCGEKLTNG